MTVLIGARLALASPVANKKLFDELRYLELDSLRRRRLAMTSGLAGRGDLSQFGCGPGERVCRLALKWGLIDSWCKSLSYNGIIRARSNSTPARPYMARLRVFSLLICPSVCPLLQGSDMAFRTASRSWRIVFAKRCIA